MTRMRWDKVRRDNRPARTEAQDIAEATRRAEQKDHRAATRPKLPGLATALNFRDRKARLFVAALLRDGIPPKSVAARTGMKLAMVQLIEEASHLQR